MSAQKPVIVYVSGAPGSGKTTLARLISEQLYIPNISSDLIHGGVAFTQPNHDRKATLHSVFVPVINNLTRLGVSVVVDHVLQKGISETDIIDKLSLEAQIVNIHTMCSDPIQRYSDRVESSDVPSVVERRAHLRELAKYHKGNLGMTLWPLELGVPLLTVNTDDGYEPALQDIIDFIGSHAA